MPKVQQQVYCRPPWERMMQIHQRLQEAKYPNCSTLARELEVATRTIKRDLDFMKYRLKLPIEYDSRRFGFYYTKPVAGFPAVAMTEAELFALLVAHKAIAQYHGTPFQRPLETAFRKLTGQLDTGAPFILGNLDEVVSFRPLAPEESDARTFQVLTQALQEGRALRFRYKNLGAARPQRRRVHPYHLACIENHWYLFAFDVQRQAIRTFSVSRLTEPRLGEERFAKRKEFDPKEYLRGSFSVFRGKADYEVVLDFDVWATDLLRGRQWHSSQDFTELPGGCSRMRLRLNSLEEIERWVLTWGTHAMVVRPKALAERIRKVAEELVARYAPAVGG